MIRQSKNSLIGLAVVIISAVVIAGIAAFNSTIKHTIKFPKLEPPYNLTAYEIIVNQKTNKDPIRIRIANKNCSKDLCSYSYVVVTQGDEILYNLQAPSTKETEELVNLLYNQATSACIR